MQESSVVTFDCQHTVVSNKIQPDLIWKLWTDINNWPRWNHGFSSCVLTGDFEVGQTFKLTPNNGPQLVATLIEVTENESFTDLTQLPFGTLTGRHYLRIDGENVIVTHQLTANIDPAKAHDFEEKLWKKISVGLPHHVQNIVDLAEQTSLTSSAAAAAVPMGYSLRTRAVKKKVEIDSDDEEADLEATSKITAAKASKNPLLTDNAKFWVAVASKDHASNGVAQGIVQVCHGKEGPLKRMKEGDWVFYYSPKESFGGNKPYQKFIGVGRVSTGKVYQFEMSRDFKPFRLDVEFLQGVEEVAIAPLISQLSFIKNKANWGMHFRFGHFEIPKADFLLISQRMGVDLNHCKFASRKKQRVDEEAASPRAKKH